MDEQGSCREEEHPTSQPLAMSKRRGNTKEERRIQSESPAMKRAEELQAKLSAELPSFIKYMGPTTVSKAFWLHIPREFSNQYLPDHDTTMEFNNKSEKMFRVKFLSNRSGLSGGWRRFSTAHNLEEGDVLVFELVKRTTFKVHIIRRNVLGETDGASGLLELDTSVSVMRPNDGENHSNAFVKAQQQPLDCMLSDSPDNLLKDPDFVSPDLCREKRRKQRSCEVDPLPIFDSIGRRMRSRKSNCAGPAPLRATHMSSDPLPFHATKMSTGSFADHFERIWKSFPADKLVHFKYLEGFYFGLYKIAAQRSNVLSWIKSKNIFSSNYVFVPICFWRHWNVLILCHFGESFDSENKQPYMLLLDSLPMADRKGQYEGDIRKFVSDIFKEEGITNQRVSKIRLMVPEVPRQKDKECGFFSLYFIKKFIETTTLETVSDGGFPHIDKNWFTRGEFEAFCIPLEEESRAREAAISQEMALEPDESWMEGDVIVIN